jgi:hypothetical protein
MVGFIPFLPKSDINIHAHREKSCKFKDKLPVGRNGMRKLDGWVTRKLEVLVK